MQAASLSSPAALNPHFDWKRVAHLFLLSRKMDDLEETKLLPERKIYYQFSARGHALVQTLLGTLLTNQHDAVSVYYRSRPMLLTLGLSIEDALASPMGKSGGFSDGRDIGVVSNLPRRGAPIVLPTAGDVGSQYTPAAGWAQAITYRRDVLGDAAYAGAIAVVLGGDGSVATNGFWSALTMATTMQLPLLFCIEDNRYGLSVPAERQTPGGNIADNLRSFKNLRILDGSGVEPGETSVLLKDGVDHVRGGKGPVLVRLTMPRLSGHSGQDTQAYKSKSTLEEEQDKDPLPRLKEYLVPELLSESEWAGLETRVEKEVEAGLQKALSRAEPDPKTIKKFVFAEQGSDGKPQLSIRGGLAVEGHRFPESTETATPEPARINLLTAIRRTLEHELATNPKLVVFGEDVGPKGGVHAATLGLQEKFGTQRVFDTSLSEEGIIGRAVGMAVAGLMPVAEIQFRKYADPATEQLHNCGTIRWRTNNRFAAPIVVRMPGGFAKCGDPWHSVSDEVMWAHSVGWQVAFPSNAEDAVGLLRSAMRSLNPTIFFEHRALLDGAWARRPYPGDSYVVPFGRARVTVGGDEISIVTWGAMVERCEEAAKVCGASAEVIDLRSISPWDSEAVLRSVKKTRRCLVVHEDTLTAGFGAEVGAFVAERAFLDLDAPVSRLAVEDVPLPYNIALMNAVLPAVETIASKIEALLKF